MNPYLTPTGARKPNPYMQPLQQKQQSGWRGMLNRVGNAAEVSKYKNRGNRAQVSRDLRNEGQQFDPRRIQQVTQWNNAQNSAADVWEKQDALDKETEGKEGVNKAYADTLKQWGSQHPGKRFPVTIDQWKQFSNATRDTIQMKLGGPGIGGGPTAAAAKQAQEQNNAKSAFKNVFDKGVFTGTLKDFGALTPSDRSRFIARASTPKEYVNREMIESEYNGSDYTAESWQKAREFGDPMALVPKESAWNTPGVNKDQMDAEISASKSYNKEMESIRMIQRNHAKMVEALNESTGAGDMAAIFTFMKTLDPPSTVREGEFALASEVAGTYERWINIKNRFEQGEILPKKAREEMAKMANRLVMLSKNERNRIRGDYIYRTERYKLDKRSVVGKDSDIYDYDNLPQYVPKRDPEVEALLGKKKEGAPNG